MNLSINNLFIQGFDSQSSQSLKLGLHQRKIVNFCVVNTFSQIKFSVITLSLTKIINKYRESWSPFRWKYASCRYLIVLCERSQLETEICRERTNKLIYQLIIDL